MVKISMARARREFNDGEKVAMLPCKLNIAEVKPIIITNNLGFGFDTVVKCCERKKCNTEDGIYLNFYKV